MTVAEALHSSAVTAYAGNIDGEGVPGTIRSGLKAGEGQPRDIPERPVTPTVTVIETPSAERVTLDEAPKRMRDGAAFILDAPDTVPTLWGDANDVIWARGEALMIVGPPGVGKTTLTGQLLRARLGLGDSKVLGYPVETTNGIVLYLAMDRPAQIARALRRAFTESERGHLSAHLKVWEGPPPADIAKRPEILVGLASIAGADTIVIDSLKDAAIGLGEDEVAAGYNRARQTCLADGIEVLELHHLVKRGPNGAKPNTLADVYGSAWLTAGAGSVLLLWGQAGDPIVELAHLKQPAGEVGPFRVIHDHQAGTSGVHHATDLLSQAQAMGVAGLSAHAAACSLFTTEKPSASDVEKARRKLNQLVEKGLLLRLEGTRGGGNDRTPTVWRPVDNPVTVLPEAITVNHAHAQEAITVPLPEMTNHGNHEQSRFPHNRRSGNHGSNHGNHGTGAITNVPPPDKGGREPQATDDEEPEEWWKR